jgi:ATP-dependent Clp protease, protease subunit
LNTIITETTDNGEVPIDIYSKLADDRILFISDYVDDKLATDITSTLLLKDIENPDGKISLFINSEGGDIRSVFMIYDMLQLLQCEIETVCIGSAMNEAALLLAAGSKGSRLATQNAAICISQLVQEKYYRANLADAKSIHKRIEADNHNFMKALAKNIGKKTDDLKIKFKDKVFMSANEAKTFGIIDDIVGVK